MRPFYCPYSEYEVRIFIHWLEQAIMKLQKLTYQSLCHSKEQGGKTKMIMPDNWKKKTIFIATYRPHAKRTVTSLRKNSSCLTGYSYKKQKINDKTKSEHRVDIPPRSIEWTVCKYRALVSASAGRSKQFVSVLDSSFHFSALTSTTVFTKSHLFSFITCVEPDKMSKTCARKKVRTGAIATWPHGVGLVGHIWQGYGPSRK